MVLSETLLQEIEAFAYKYLSREEIEIITGVNADQMKDLEDPAGKAFIKGRLKRKAEYNFSLIKLSNQLSSPAMAIEHKIAEQTFLNDLK